MCHAHRDEQNFLLSSAFETLWDVMVCSSLCYNQMCSLSTNNVIISCYCFSERMVLLIHWNSSQLDLFLVCHLLASKCLKCLKFLASVLDITSDINNIALFVTKCKHLVRRCLYMWPFANMQWPEFISLGIYGIIKLAGNVVPWDNLFGVREEYQKQVTPWGSQLYGKLLHATTSKWAGANPRELLSRALLPKLPFLSKSSLKIPTGDSRSTVERKISRVSGAGINFCWRHSRGSCCAAWSWWRWLRNWLWVSRKAMVCVFYRLSRDQRIRVRV